jgi:hypothetical protein
MPRIEIKDSKLSSIIKKCESLKLDTKKVKIETATFEDLTNPDEYYTKLYLRYENNK